MRLQEAMGRAVVARDTAENLGEVHGAVVDVASRRMVALQVGKGHKARLVDWTSITGVGPDAVVVEAESSLRPPQGDREARIVKGDIPLLGGRVLSDQGDVVGELDDVEFDEATGALQALAIDGTSVPASRLLAVGGYAVVVASQG